MTRATAAERDEAIKMLKALLSEGDRVYTVIRSVSPSGMSRTMDVFLIRGGNLRRITSYVCDALQYKWDTKRCCLSVRGCGMDMGFAVVYELAAVLFGDGYKLQQEWI